MQTEFYPSDAYGDDAFVSDNDLIGFRKPTEMCMTLCSRWRASGNCLPIGSRTFTRSRVGPLCGVMLTVRLSRSTRSRLRSASSTRWSTVALSRAALDHSQRLDHDGAGLVAGANGR